MLEYLLEYATFFGKKTDRFIKSDSQIDKYVNIINSLTRKSAPSVKLNSTYMKHKL